MSDKKPRNHKPMFIVAAIFIVLLVAMFYATPVAVPPPQDKPAQTETADNGLTPAPDAAATPIDVEGAMSERVMGDANAPLRIVEHASLTCSHCAEFSNNTFAELKKNYIDTGKAYFVFSDFPLNAPALQAAAVARCLPHEKYFDFVHFLFEHQSEWAYDPAAFRNFLKTHAMENGLGEDAFNACIDSPALQKAIQDRMKAVQEQWKIQSTPSFVLNNKTTVAGAYPYDAFAKLLEEEITRSKQPAPADGSTPDAAAAPTPSPDTQPVSPSPEEAPPE